MRRAMLLAALSVLLACALAQRVFETIVRRFDTLTALGVGCDALGREGWRIVSVTPQGDAAYVVVLQRERPSLPRVVDGGR